MDNLKHPARREAFHLGRLIEQCMRTLCYSSDEEERKAAVRNIPILRVSLADFVQEKRRLLSFQDEELLRQCAELLKDLEEKLARLGEGSQKDERPN